MHGGKKPVPYEAPDSPDPKGIWRFVGARRRLTLLALMIAQTVAATWAMSTVLPYHGRDWLEAVIIVLFAVLFCWVSAGFWTAITGFLLLAFHGDRFVISRRAARDAVIPDDARTAIVMPIANEDVQRVFAGLRATYESLERTGHLEHFDFFVLSDSGDPDIRTAEADAWLHLCRALNGFGRIFYRWRRHRVKRKSGNIDDFCRRWGGKYRYMIVLDADSVMSGDCLTRLVQLMEGAPSAGIIQTAPRAAGRDTLYARIQQFATRVYGPLFTAGLHYWQLGESHYWGHNAIIRLDPFIKHCALAPIPGKGSLSGEIMSHDFVEAALMRRAGWAVWIAYDLDGSYEEMPPNLLDELGRDRRWCHGNLMNFRLFGTPGFHRVHRAVFITGVMAYLSAPLWFLFLLLSTALLAKHTLIAPEYFTQPRQLFPIWPEWHPEKAAALFSATATVLFLPKILSVLVLWAQGPKRFGGALHLALSMVIEAAFSVLAAPVRMLFHAFRDGGIPRLEGALEVATAGRRTDPLERRLPPPWAAHSHRHRVGRAGVLAEPELPVVAVAGGRGVGHLHSAVGVLEPSQPGPAHAPPAAVHDSRRGASAARAARHAQAPAQCAADAGLPPGCRRSRHERPDVRDRHGALSTRSALGRRAGGDGATRAGSGPGQAHGQAEAGTALGSVFAVGAASCGVVVTRTACSVATARPGLNTSRHETPRPIRLLPMGRFNFPLHR